MPDRPEGSRQQSLAAELAGAIDQKSGTALIAFERQSVAETAR
jgi:hypothetical protein